ncbi:UNVERIFIED_ORG: hypothetical protein QE434_001413 [Rhizobium sp. SORGH_AS 755]|nr:hypothetical protein [Rhizobium sp. SORGH_AS_0755]
MIKPGNQPGVISVIDRGNFKDGFAGALQGAQLVFLAKDDIGVFGAVDVESRLSRRDPRVQGAAAADIERPGRFVASPQNRHDDDLRPVRIGFFVFHGRQANALRKPLVDSGHNRIARSPKRRSNRHDDPHGMRPAVEMATGRLLKISWS